MSATSLPDCVQSGAAALAAEVGCGQDLACGCHISAYLAGLQPLIYQQCSDSSSALAQAQQFCVAANPHLLDNRRATFIIPISIFLVLAVITVILRLYSRHISNTKVGPDDWLSIAALGFAILSNVLELYGLANGEGTHQFMVALHVQERSNKTTIATDWTITAAILMLKLSILALYLRLFGTIRKFAIAVYAVGIFIIVASIIAAVVFTCQCRPVAYFWNRAIPGGSCWNFQKVIISIAGVDLLTGAMLLALPIPILLGLQMSLAKKVAIGFLFAIGGFTCIAGALRIPMVLFVDIYDIFWSLVPFTIFSCIEVNLGVISICLPAMRPLFGKILDLRMFSSIFSRNSRSTSKKHSHILDNDVPTIGKGKVSRTTDSERILNSKIEDEEGWPMHAIEVQKEIDVQARKHSRQLTPNDVSIV